MQFVACIHFKSWPEYRLFCMVVLSLLTVITGYPSGKSAKPTDQTGA